MDINCTSKCVYQQEGKCTLNELPALTSMVGQTENADCPYCAGEPYSR